MEEAKTLIGGRKEGRKDVLKDDDTSLTNSCPVTFFLRRLIRFLKDADFKEASPSLRNLISLGFLKRLKPL